MEFIQIIVLHVWNKIQFVHEQNKIEEYQRDVVSH